MWGLQTAVYVSNWRICFGTINFHIFSQTLSEKHPAVLSKLDSTWPEEPMKNEVLSGSSLILKNVLAIWRRYFGFRLKHFNRVVNTAFNAFRENNSTRLFWKLIFFHNDYRASSENFSIFGRIFPRGGQWCILRFRGKNSR